MDASTFDELKVARAEFIAGVDGAEERFVRKIGECMFASGDAFDLDPVELQALAHRRLANAPIMKRLQDIKNRISKLEAAFGSRNEK